MSKISPGSSLLSDTQKLLDNLGPLPWSVDRPVFLALSGLPGTGKSYISRKIARKVPVVIIESDAMRKILFPRPSHSWQESARLFKACYFLIEKLLGQGISLILDATNLTERYRKKLYNIAEKAKAKFILVKTVAPPALVRQRLRLRKRNPLNLSDADWEIYQSMKHVEEKIRHKHYVVDTSRDITHVVNKIICEIEK
jgi:predicted kinase